MGICIVGSGVQWGGPGCRYKFQTHPLGSGIYGPVQDEITRSEPRRPSLHLPAQPWLLVRETTSRSLCTVGAAWHPAGAPNPG